VIIIYSPSSIVLAPPLHSMFHPGADWYCILHTHDLCPLSRWQIPASARAKTQRGSCVRRQLRHGHNRPIDEGNKFVRERMGKGRPDFTSSNNQIHIFILLGRYNRPHHNPQRKANLPHQYYSHLITPTLPYLIYMKSFTTRQHVAVRSSSIEAVVKGECTDTKGSLNNTS
jgi:hypothetical protein